jgi:hypothetical protein
MDKKLNIILPNTNKALAKVLKKATDQELESIAKGKDLKSILNSLLTDSTQEQSSNKALLNLVKNNPVFKELSTASQNLQELINTLKSDKNLQHIQKMLEKFLPDMKDVKNLDVKNTLENSGVFLESKLKNIKEPINELKNTLKELAAQLSKSEVRESKPILNDVKNILQQLDTKNPNEKQMQSLTKDIQNISQKIELQLKQADPITTKDFSTKLEKLEHLLEPKNLEKTNFSTANLKKTLESLVDTLNSSYTKESTSAKQTLQNAVQNINTQLQKELPKTMQNIQNSIESQKPNIQNKELLSTLNNLQKDLSNALKNTPTATQFTQLQDISTQLLSQAQSMPNTESKSLVDILQKIFKPLQELEQTLNIDTKNIKDIKNVTQELKTEITKADPLYSEGVKKATKELLVLNSPQKLSTQENIKEILSNDFKAALHKASEELTKAQTPIQAELTKQIDKLSLQIDYYQLVSHLSDSSSLYIPFSWEQMQDGEISIKHSKDDRFYCDIDLKLKDYGELNLRLTLYDKNQLNIYIKSDSDEFKQIIKEAIPELRRALVDVQITPRDIRVLSKSKEIDSKSVYDEIARDLDIGFEVRG